MTDLELASRVSRARRGITLWLIYRVTDGARDYVGCTMLSIDQRWQQHLRNARRQTWTSGLHQAIRQLGPARFRASVLAEALTREDASAKEQRWIERLNCREPHGFNRALKH